MNTELFMSSFLSLERVQARTTLSRSTLYRKMAEGTFPRQFSITPRRVVWSEDAIEESKTMAPNDEIQAGDHQTGDLEEEEDSQTNFYIAVGITVALTLAYYIRRRR